MKTLILSFTLFAAGFTVAGCGKGPCDELQDICNKCKDATTKESCNTAVRTYKAAPTGDTACQAALDAHSFQQCE